MSGLLHQVSDKILEAALGSAGSQRKGNSSCRYTLLSITPVVYWVGKDELARAFEEVVGIYSFFVSVLLFLFLAILFGRT